MRIALTGSGGFLGSALLLQAKLAKYYCNTFKLYNHNHIKKFFNEIKSKDYDYIINCAACLNPKNKHDFYINEKLPNEIQKIILQNNMKTKLIHISSLNILNKKLNDKYTVSKLKSEKELLKKNLIIIRPNLIINSKFENNYSEFSNYLKFPMPIYPMVYPGNIYRPVNLNEICKFILSLTNIDITDFRIYNVQGLKKISTWEIFNKICSLNNKKPLKIYINFLHLFIPNFVINFLCKKRFLQQFFVINRFHKKESINEKNIFLKNYL